MSKKLIIDSIALLSPLTGIGRYTYEISKNIKRLDKYEINFFYGYYSKELIEPSCKSELKSLKKILTNNKLIKKIVRRIILFSASISRKKYDLYWQPNFIPKEQIDAKKVVTTVHDFSFILYRNFHPKERIEYFENNFFSSINRSDIIITGSQFSKREIQERLSLSGDKIKVIYHGIDHNIFKVYDQLDVDLKLPQKFILSVGSIEPRKNLLSLLKAYNSLDENIKKEYTLVLVGFKGWSNDEIMNLIYKNKENIHYLGFISDIELAKVYNFATCFVFPSFYEGFGLPILEAMACGTPVLSSHASSMPEVGGDAVEYFDPYNIVEIKEKLEFLLSNRNLQKDMRERGLQRSLNFSWKKSAQEHIKIFEELLNEI